MQSDIDGFYAWTARDGSGSGACGVTEDAARAVKRLTEALERLAPDARGHYGVVKLDRRAKNPAYTYGRIVARLRRHASAVVLEPAE